MSLQTLEQYQPDLLAEIERCRRERVPMTLSTNGFEHIDELAMALLRCAHAYDVSLTFVPTRVVNIGEAAAIQREDRRSESSNEIPPRPGTSRAN